MKKGRVKSILKKGIVTASIPLVMGASGCAWWKKDIHGEIEKPPVKSELVVSNDVDEEAEFHHDWEKERKEWLTGVIDFTEGKNTLFFSKDRETETDLLLLLDKRGKILNLVERHRMLDVFLSGSGDRVFSQKMLDELKIPRFETSKELKVPQKRALEEARASKRSFLDNLLLLTAIGEPEKSSQQEIIFDDHRAIEVAVIPMNAVPPLGYSVSEYIQFQNRVSLNVLEGVIGITEDKNCHYEIDVKALVSLLGRDSLLTKSKDFSEIAKKGTFAFSRESLLERSEKLGVAEKMEGVFEEMDEILAEKVLSGEIKFPESPVKGKRDNKPFQDRAQRDSKGKVL